MSEDTAELYRIKRTPEPVAAENEANEAASLLANMLERIEWVERLMAGRGDALTRAQLRSELRHAIAAAQQLDGHLAEADQADPDPETESAWLGWLTAPGGEERASS
jgi:hypothetical protein